MARLATALLIYLAAVCSAFSGVVASPLRAQSTDLAVREFSDWSVACDNARQCVAVSVSRAFVTRTERAEPGDLASPKLWLRRDAAPDAPLRIILDTRIWGEAPSDGPERLDIRIVCDAACITRSFPLIRLEPGLYELPADYTASFLIENRYGHRAITTLPGGEEHGIVTTAGLAAALRWIDDAQHRAGTVSAMLAYGEAPARTVPPPPQRPLVPVMRAVGQDEFVLADIPRLAEWQQWLCEPGENDAVLPVERFALADGHALWSIGCGAGPYVEPSLWLVETPAGELSLHALPRPDIGRQADPPILRNSRFDMQSGMLVTYSGGMCGWQRRWAWTGQAFAMIDSIEMPACHDILPNNWLQTYRAVPE